jgi:hypothetical protein
MLNALAYYAKSLIGKKDLIELAQEIIESSLTYLQVGANSTKTFL